MKYLHTEEHKERFGRGTGQGEKKEPRTEAADVLKHYYWEKQALTDCIEASLKKLYYFSPVKMPASIKPVKKVSKVLQLQLQVLCLKHT